MKRIEYSTIKDIEEIFRLYRIAAEYQKLKSASPWPEFNRSLIEAEINERRQWKMVINEQIACVWAVTFDDPQIWEEKNKEPAVYIHRIATEPNFRGKKLVGEIVSWANDYAEENGKLLVRLDTVGENLGLIKYYKECGFNFLGLRKLENTDGLPAHYQDATVSLFEFSVKNIKF